MNSKNDLCSIYYKCVDGTFCCMTSASFYDALSILEYVVLMAWWLLNKELEKIFKKVVMV